jgi:Ni/Co efflux regulator RcnB
MKNTSTFLLTAVSALALSCAPAIFAQEHHDDAQDHPSQDRKDDAQRADRDARPDAGQAYKFRDEDAPKLRQHYKNVEKVDVSKRTALVAGARLEGDWRRRLRPVPAAVVRELAPPPPGYVFGYIDGYCVVYNPATLVIAEVIDLAKLTR